MVAAPWFVARLFSAPLDERSIGRADENQFKQQSESKMNGIPGY
jgi:hypothetical protein